MEFKNIKNDKLMRNLRNKLDMKIFDLIKFDPEFCFYKSDNGRYDDEIKYNFYNKCKLRSEKSIYSIDFGFSITGEDEVDILSKYERNNNISELTDKEIKEVIKNINDIRYVIINSLYIRPKHTGLGTMIIKMFIDEIKKIESLEKVYLSPKDDDAKRFWSKCGFIEETSLERPSNMYDYNMSLSLR